MGTVTTSQFAFADGSNVTPAECDPGDFKDDDIPDSATMSTDPDNTGMIINGLCIKAGGGMDDHGEFFTTNQNPTPDGCFIISGLGTTEAKVTEDFDTGENCMNLSHVDYVKNGVIVGGYLISIDTTAVLLAGAQFTAAWIIPVIVAGIGFAIVIARKF